MSSNTLTADNGVTSGTSGIKYNGGNDGTLQLQTTTAGGTATTALTIDNSQNVGIGTSSPSTYGKLVSVTGDNATTFAAVGATNMLRVQGYNSTYVGTVLESVNLAQNANTPMFINASQTKFGISGVSKMTLDASGNLAVSAGNITASGTLNTTNGHINLGTSYINGVNDANWGILYKPSKAGAAAAHGFLNDAGGGIVTITNAGALNAAGTISGTNITIGGNTTGNAATATKFSSGQSNWYGTGIIDSVVGMMAWKNYSNSHVIFDASASTSPSGTSVNNTNSTYPWGASYPTLMGWNGSGTYGVRVDSARIADTIFGTLTDRTGSRASNTTYTNSTGRPLTVYCSFNNTNGGATLYMNGSIIRYINGYGNGPGVTFIVPNGYTYQVAMNSAVNKWWEY
jgi:hypothetical protein